METSTSKYIFWQALNLENKSSPKAENSSYWFILANYYACIYDFPYNWEGQAIYLRSSSNKKELEVKLWLSLLTVSLIWATTW